MTKRTPIQGHAGGMPHMPSDAEMLAAIQRLDKEARVALAAAMVRFRDGKITGEQAAAEFGEYCRNRIEATALKGVL